MDENDTPTINPESVQILLARVRRSSQARIETADLAAMRIMHLDGMLFRESARDLIQGAVRQIVAEVLQTYHDSMRRIQDDAESHAETSLAHAEKEVFRLRKEIFDFVQHGDLDR